ncbi:hypothetical protein FGB62_69g04 [Gracilaria domingensis]|nr:hypothetical protein FGB62_69g04 [Gracilaria domingensis]
MGASHFCVSHWAAHGGASLRHFSRQAAVHLLVRRNLPPPRAARPRTRLLLHLHAAGVARLRVRAHHGRLRRAGTLHQRLRAHRQQHCYGRAGQCWRRRHRLRHATPMGKLGLEPGIRFRPVRVGFLSRGKLAGHSVLADGVRARLVAHAVRATDTPQADAACRPNHGFHRAVVAARDVPHAHGAAAGQRAGHVPNGPVSVLQHAVNQHHCAGCVRAAQLQRGGALITVRFAVLSEFRRPIRWLLVRAHHVVHDHDRILRGAVQLESLHGVRYRGGD